MFDRPGDVLSFMRRVAAFYAALFVIYGTQVPFLPVWLDWRGMSVAEISLIMSLPFFLRLVVTPAVAVAADRNGAHRKMLVGLAWAALAAALLLSQMWSFTPILVLTVALIISVSTMMPMIETIAVTGVRRAGLDYGRMRLWGSLTFIAASIAGGAVVTKVGASAGVYLIATGCALTVIAAHLLPRPPRIEGVTPDGRALPVRRRQPFWQAPEVTSLLANPTFRMFLLAGGLCQAAHATLLAFGALIWQQQGLSGLSIGTLWAIAVLAEVVLFAVSARVVARVGIAMLLSVAAGVSIIRWLAMAAAPDLVTLVPLQVLHALTFGASHIAAISFLRAAIPERMSGTAQALYSAMAAGLAMGVATLIAGWIYAHAGAWSYLAMVVISALSLAFSVRLSLMWNGGVLPLQTDDDAAGARGAVPSVCNSDAPVPLPPEGGISG